MLDQNIRNQCKKNNPVLDPLLERKYGRKRGFGGIYFIQIDDGDGWLYGLNYEPPK